MHHVQLQLTDQLYDLVKRRAVEAGFASLDEYIVEVVSDDITAETENLDHRFTPAVIAELDRVSANAKAGGKVYTAAEADEYLRQKANEWRDSQVS